MKSDSYYRIGLSDAPLPPMLNGLPFLGSALALGKDPVQFFLNSYAELGAIFRMQVFQKRITVLAGLDANLFMQREAAQVFSNQDIFIGLVRELGTSKNLANLEGEAHALFRRTAHHGYSPSMMRQQAALAIDFTEQFIKKLPLNSSFDVFATMQTLTSLQLGKILTQLEGDHYINDLQTFMEYLLFIHVTGLYPKFLMHLPHYKKAKASALKMAHEIVNYHIAYPVSATRPADIVDDFLEAHRYDPIAMPMDAVIAAALGPFLAGQDTVAATTAFMLYAILADKTLYDRIQAEVAGLFAKGTPEADDFRHAESLHLTAIETLRRYPVAMMMPLMTSQEFEFKGYKVEKNQFVYLVQTLTQFLPEYYEQPFEFNIDRAKGKSGTMASFGLGPHSCIGAGMAELLIMLNIATLLHHTKLELSPLDYQLKLRAIPSAPAKFRVKIIEKYP